MFNIKSAPVFTDYKYRAVPVGMYPYPKFSGATIGTHVRVSKSTRPVTINHKTIHGYGGRLRTWLRKQLLVQEVARRWCGDRGVTAGGSDEGPGQVARGVSEEVLLDVALHGEGVQVEVLAAPRAPAVALLAQRLQLK